ncbi:MAG: methylmalonyl Co-A mutase-associated GTPase MeaB [Deinococcales bacterium]
MLERFVAGDLRALARAITWVESFDTRGFELLQDLRGKQAAKSLVVGMTGAPGAGKSTLTDALITQCRAAGAKVAVLCIDPSSPFSGGAILGDRIRMGRHHQDKGVFIRSMASRGALGGLSKTTVSALALLEAFGFEYIFLETVGVGQSEVDIASVADHTILVLTPAGGDAVQAFKAGIMEIADVFCINKADLPGADRLLREIRAAQELGAHDQHTWFAPIIQTIGSEQKGVTELLEAIKTHRIHLGEAGLAVRRLERARFELNAAIQSLAQEKAKDAELELLHAIECGKKTARQVARIVLGVTA